MVDVRNESAPTRDGPILGRGVVQSELPRFDRVQEREDPEEASLADAGWAGEKDGLAALDGEGESLLEHDATH